MRSLNAKFLISAEKLSQCPNYNLSEFPLLGRSNVGKSSFINALANNNKIAKTSNTPGKTRLINFFDFSQKFVIADLPGYGYAQVTKEVQDKWQKNLEEYLLNRSEIKSLIHLIDARHDIQKNDFQMRDWVNTNTIPVITVVTKFDYVPRSKALNVLSKIKDEFGGEVFPFSAVDKQYCQKILNYLLDLSK